MGLGSLRTSPFLDPSFARMVTEGNNREGGDAGERADPPAQKYPRVCSPSTSFPSDLPGPLRSLPSPGYEHGVGGGGTRPDHVSLVAPNQPRESSPMPEAVLEGVLSECPNAVEESVMVLDACDEGQEGSNLEGDRERAGNPCGEFDGEQISSPTPPLSLAFSPTARGSRKHREFTPESRKDETYWEKRRKNNEAARKSREKRRLHDLLLENRIVDLEEDNSRLRVELHSLKKRYGIPLDTEFVTHATPERPSDDPCCRRRPVSHRRRSVCAGEGGLPPRLNPIGDPPPSSLLTLASAGLPASVQQMEVAGVFPPQTSSLPFLMPAFPAELSLAHAASTQAVAYPFIPLAPHHDSAVLVRTDAAQGDLCPHSVAIKQERYEEEGARDCGAMHTRWAPGFCQGTAGTPFTPATTAALYGWSEAVPASPSLDQFPAHSCQRSPLGSNGSDDTSDEPLQLTVHRRGSSKSECVGEDSGSESASIKGSPCSADSRFSSPSSLPVKLRYKRPATSSPLRQHNLGGLDNTANPSSVNGLMAGLFSTTTTTTTTAGPSQLNGVLQLSEVILQDTPLSLVKRESPGTQDCPLSLVKKDPAHSAETACQEVTGSANLDPTYLERRRRNNEAARKCREKRRDLTRLREVKSDHLLTENSQLRQEMDSLQEGMKQLRELLDQRGGKSGEDRQVAWSQQHAQRLQQLQKEHRLLRLEQRRLEKRREKRQQQQQQRANNLLSDTLDDRRDVN